MGKKNEQSNSDTPKLQASLADMVAFEGEVSVKSSVETSSWLKVAILGLLCVGCYWVQLRQLLNQWLADPNWSHGFIIPLFSLYLLYNWRREIFSAPRRVCLWGWVFILGAFLIKTWGIIVVHNTWIPQLTISLLIFGLVLYLCGPKIAIVAFVPVFYLTLAMPWPDSLYQEISGPMQELAAKWSTALLHMFGAEITVTASFLKITSISGEEYPLRVAEACSGMRSLMAFVALGVAMAYVEERPFWQRLVIMIGGVPIALACNILRVAATSAMFVIDKKELGEDFMHTAMGMVLLIPALFLLLLLSRLLNAIYVDVEDDDEDDNPVGSQENSAPENPEVQV